MYSAVIYANGVWFRQTYEHDTKDAVSFVIGKYLNANYNFMLISSHTLLLIDYNHCLLGTITIRMESQINLFYDSRKLI